MDVGKSDNNFKVDSIEYGGQWIAISGVNASTKFSCVIVGVYASTSVSKHIEPYGMNSLSYFEELARRAISEVYPLVFTLNDYNYLHHIKRIFRWFELVSGLG